MFDRLKSQWAALKRSRPGHRFQDRYERNLQSRNGAKTLWRIVRIVIAAGFVVLGVLFMFIPGPAIAFYAIAGALLATDSLPLAKLLDWIEVRSRRMARWAAAKWQPLPLAAKLTLGTLGVCGSITSTWLLYRFVAQ
ncbi:MAG: hypothetical protein HYV96_01740 [Opitutae bacterium]|nr:hypothetical protein [Opitutae bacterium]